MAAVGAGNAGANRQPDFVRYFLQFPPVTRTLITLIAIVSISIQLGFVNRYSLYTSFWGSFLRFFDAGWGLWFLMTLIMSMRFRPPFLILSLPAKLAS